MLLPEQQTGPGKQLFIAESNSVTDCVLICVNFMKVFTTATLYCAIQLFNYHDNFFSKTLFQFNEFTISGCV
jgi:hypothetical protein